MPKRKTFAPDDSSPIIIGDSTTGLRISKKMRASLPLPGFIYLSHKTFSLGTDITVTNSRLKVKDVRSHSLPHTHPPPTNWHLVLNSGAVKINSDDNRTLHIKIPSYIVYHAANGVVWLIVPGASLSSAQLDHPCENLWNDEEIEIHFG